MTVILLLTVSIGIQISAAVLALRLIPVTHKCRAWVLISAALGLMAFRPTITVVESMAGKMSYPEDLITEWLSLMVSVLLLAGIAQIAPLFRASRSSVENLRESEERYRSLFENSMDGVLLTSPDGRVFAANPAACRMFGRTSEEICGIGRDGLLDTAASRIVAFSDQNGGVAGTQSELIGLRKDGSRFPLEVGWAPFKNRTGEERVCAVVRDATPRKEAEEAREKARDELECRVAARTSELTRTNRQLKREIEERRHAEQSLRASEQKYRALVENITDAVYIRDLEGYFTFVTPQAERLTGYTRQELLQMSFRDLLYPERIPSVEKSAARLADGEVMGLTELEIRHANGHPIPIEVFATPLRGAHDSRTIAVQGAARDISQRKRAESERILLATAVQQAEEGIVITDAEGRIQYVNPAFVRMSGFTRQELIHRNVSLVESGKHSDAYYREVLDTLARGEVWKGQFINRRKDGQFFEVQATISPIRDESGRIIHHVAIEHDVTHAVRLEKQLRQVQKMDAVGALASGIAHDFNNILATIIGQAELAVVNLPKDHSTQRNLDLLLQAGYHARNLLRQIFSLGRKQLTPVPVPLTLVVREVIRLLQPTLPENIRVCVDETLPKDSFTVPADPTQMQQVLMNLCTNAVHAMQTDGGTLRVEFREETIDGREVGQYPSLPPGTYVKMSVSDTGHGIDDKDGGIDRIFDPFYTTKPVGKGTGLGLAVVFAIVRNHGGAIAVRSRPGEGTCFQVFLPKSW